MTGSGVVYGLYHPVTGELRYVGQTWQPLPRRLTGHVTAARRNPKRHVAAWVRHLLDQSLRPVIKELGRAESTSSLDQLEMTLIAESRAKGHQLTNHSDGGRGGRKGVPSPRRGMTLGAETRAKISASKRGCVSHMKGKHHTVATRARISATKRGVATGARRADVRVEDIILALREGLSIVQIAEFLKVDRHTVRQRLRTAGGPVPKREIATSLVLSELEGGSSKREVARKLGVSVHFIYGRLRRAGLILPEKRGPRPTEVR